MWKGTYTAIITPFTQDGAVDEDALRNLVDAQIAAGVTGVVPCGTTGESPTLSDEEMKQVMQITVDQVKGRCKVIGGAGSNSTHHAIVLTKMAKEVGCDAVLQVNPYYNKPTQEGLYQHFKAIHDAVDIPIVLYNIKGRTAVNVETPTLLRLCALKNIVAVKEASGDLDQIKEVIEQSPDDFTVLSGDDNITLELIKLGGHGVISVIANVVPEKMVSLVNSALDGNTPMAEQEHTELSPLMEAEFIETNPIPVKYMMHLLGRCEESYRLPMCSLSDENKEKVKAVLDNANVSSERLA